MESETKEPKQIPLKELVPFETWQTIFEAMMEKEQQRWEEEEQRREQEVQRWEEEERRQEG